MALLPPVGKFYLSIIVGYSRLLVVLAGLLRSLLLRFSGLFANAAATSLLLSRTISLKNRSVSA